MSRPTVHLPSILPDGGYAARLDGRFITEQQVREAEPGVGGPYTVTTEKEASGHRWGDGGETASLTVLAKGGRPVLLSVRVVRYGTYSDDSDDYPMPEVRTTYLLEEDPVARRVFDAARASAGAAST